MNMVNDDSYFNVDLPIVKLSRDFIETKKKKEKEKERRGKIWINLVR